MKLFRSLAPALAGLAGAAMLFVSNLPAQTTLGSILGLVTDSSGAVVPDVAVVVRNVDKNIDRIVRTRATGLYEVLNLVPGRYSVTVEERGFKKAVITDILLQTSERVRVDVKLEMGDVSQSISVEATPPGVNTDSADVASIRSSQEILSMPITRYTGSYYAIVLLTPGAVATGGAPSLGGSRGNQSNVSIDGTNTWTTLDGAAFPKAQSSLEMTSEMRVQLANDKAESAAPTGFYASTKSGTNAFHGSGFWYHSNSRLAARNTYSNTIPFRVENNYGGSFSGPVIKNRTFFIVVLERYPQRFQSLYRVNVPTVAFRAGDFSSLLPATVVRDPYNNRTPFAGNIIPATRINPVSLKAQNMWYPLPNAGPANSYQTNWQYSPDYTNLYTQAEGRVDHKFSDRNSLFLRWSRNNLTTDIQNSPLPAVPRMQVTNPGTIATLSDTHTFTPTLINEFRVGTNRSRGLNIAPADGPAAVAALGLQGLAPSSIPNGMPWMQITGFQELRVPNPYFLTIVRVEDWVDNLTWIRGNHTVKAGIRLTHNLASRKEVTYSFGQYAFDSTFTGFPYGDFLMGTPATSRRSIVAQQTHFTATDLGAFVQDDWKVSRRLTLNLGIRYDYDPPYRDRYDRIYSFDIGSGNVVIPNAEAAKWVLPTWPSTIPVKLASELGWPESLFYSSKLRFSPRFGFAYRPFSGNHTVVRGGFGVYTDYNSAFLTQNLTGGPFASIEAFTNSLVNGAPQWAFPMAFPGGFGAIGAQSISPSDPHMRNPYMMQYNLTIERELKGTTFRVSYIGTGSRQLVNRADANKPYPSTQAFNANRRPWPNLVSMFRLVNGGTHQTNMLNVVGERKFRNGLHYQLGWTWAKALSDTTQDSDMGWLPENPYNRRAERSVRSYMPLHRVVGTMVYELPFGPGRKWLGSSKLLSTLIGGWNLSTILNVETGQYFSPSFSTYDVSNTNTLGGRPDRIADGNLPGSQRSLRHWFDQTAFRVPGDTNGDLRPDVAVGRFGNSQPNVLRGPGIFNIHAALQREFRISERVKALLEGSFTNVLNHVNPNNPAANISVPASVGIITSAKDPRIGRVALRVQF